MQEFLKTASPKSRRRDTTLPPHVDDALVAFADLTGRSISAALALAAERGVVALAEDLARTNAATSQLRKVDQ